MAGGEFTKSFWGGLGQGLPGAALGAIAMPFQLMEGARQRQFQKSATEAQLAAANYATQQGAANQMMSLFSQAGENTAGRVASMGWGADLDFGRQLTGERLQRSEFDPKDIGLSYERAKRSQDLALNPEAREAAFQTFLNNKREKGTSAAFGGANLMFGPTAFTQPYL
jgi:hypothetical protein